MRGCHYTFPADDGLAFGFFDGEVVVHSRMGIKESAAFAADILHSIGIMQEKEEKKNEPISNQSTDSES